MCVCVCVCICSGPTGVLPPSLQAVSSSEILVSWLVPSSPNGVILNYSIFQDGLLLTSTLQPSSFLSSGLQPFTEYRFQVQVCTGAGCALSANSTSTTLEAGSLLINCLFVCLFAVVY